MIQEKESNTGNSPTDNQQIHSMLTSVILSRTEESRQVVARDQLITMDLHEQQQLQFQLQQHIQNQQQPHPQEFYLQQQHVNYNDTNNRQLILDPISCFGAFDDYASSSNQAPSAMTELANTSDTSNVDDGTNNEADLLAPDEAYTYLQGLDSGNLMQFSQQSVVNDLIRREHLDLKPSLNVLPTFEEHDIGGYKFQLNLRNQRKDKVNWIYSEALNKVYIRMNEMFSIDAVYTPKMPLQQLRLRALMCFVKEVSEPVLRCQNHISKDQESHKKKRHSLLRCDNPNAEYCGSAEGISINDRFSIVLPLAISGVVRKDDNSVKQSIALKFTCQNSCIGRKETSLIFVLEGMNGEILSQRVLDVKICSCPKRDCTIDERNKKTTKRKMDEDLYPRTKKMLKKESAAIKKEYNSSEGDSDEETQGALSSIERMSKGNIRLVLEPYSKDLILVAIDAMLNRLCRKMVSEPTTGTSYAAYRKLKRLYDKAYNI